MDMAKRLLDFHKLLAFRFHWRNYGETTTAKTFPKCNAKRAQPARNYVVYNPLPQPHGKSMAKSLVVSQPEDLEGGEGDPWLWPCGFEEHRSTLHARSWAQS